MGMFINERPAEQQEQKIRNPLHHPIDDARTFDASDPENPGILLVVRDVGTMAADFWYTLLGGKCGKGRVPFGNGGYPVLKGVPGAYTLLQYAGHDYVPSDEEIAAEIMEHDVPVEVRFFRFTEFRQVWGLHDNDTFDDLIAGMNDRVFRFVKPLWQRNQVNA